MRRTKKRREKLAPRFVTSNRVLCGMQREQLAEIAQQLLFLVGLAKVRVDAKLLDQLLNTSGEVSIARARLEQQLASIDFNLGELSRTVTRLKEQLRKLEIETETQILHGHEEKGGSHRGDFDPLELDRYSSIQQFSRGVPPRKNLKCLRKLPVPFLFFDPRSNRE